MVSCSSIVHGNPSPQYPQFCGKRKFQNKFGLNFFSLEKNQFKESLGHILFFSRKLLNKKNLGISVPSEPIRKSSINLYNICLGTEPQHIII